MTALVATLALVSISAMSAGAAPAAAATVAVHEIKANWLNNPTSVPYGGTITGEWHINTNDASDPYAKDPVDNVTVTVTMTNARFVSIPSACKTSGVTPASSISADGATLTCNLGTIKEGTSTVLQAPVRATSQTGGAVSGTGTVTSDQAQATAGPAALPPVPITYTHGLDLDIEAPAPGIGGQGAFFDDANGNRRQYVKVNFAIILKNGSRPGPANYNFPLKVSTSTTGGTTAGMRWEDCIPVTNAGAQAAKTPGIPFSAPAFADRTNFPGCSVTPATGTSYTVSLSGLDYTLTHVPVNDALGNPLPGGGAYIASGTLRFSLPAPRNVTTAYDWVATPPAWHFTDGVVAADSNATDNSATATITVPGGFSDAWLGQPTNGRSPWDDGLFVSPGTSQGTQLPSPNGGHDPLPLYMQATSSEWQSYNGPGAAQMAGACTMSTTKNFVIDYADFGGFDPVDSYQPLPTGRIFYTTATLNTKTETCGEAAPSTMWHELKPAAGTSPSDPRVPGDNLVTLPAGVTALKVTWNPGPDGPFEVYVRGFGHIAPTAPLNSEGWTVGAFNYDLGNGTAHAWVNFSNTNANGDPSGVTTATPWSKYAPGTNGFRDVFRVIGSQGIITKTTPATTAEPGVPVTYTITAQSQSSVVNPPNNTWTVTDTLPAGMLYVQGSANPPPTTINGQTLTWTFTNVAQNVNQTITYQAETPADSTLAPGTNLTNTASIAVPGDTRPIDEREDSATVTVPNTSQTTLGKSAADNVLSFYGDSSAWVLSINSFDPVSNPYTDTIDILPTDADGRGTNIDGTYTIGTVTAPTGSKIYYSTAPFASLSLDPRDASNGGPDTVVGNTVGWTTTKPANPTAIRVIGPALAPGGLQTIRINYTTPAGTDCVNPAPNDNKPGQQLVNSAGSYAGHTALPMYSSATATIGDCYAMDLKKYVLTKGGDPANDADWHDANDVADYPQYAVGDTVPFKIVVTNKGTGTLTNIAVTDPKAPGCNATIASLAPGASQTINCSMTAAVGTTVNTATGSTTPPDGPPLTPSDPGGFVVPDPYHIVKTSDPVPGSAVTPGTVVHYTITVTEPQTSAAPFPNPVYTDNLAGVLDDATYNGDVNATVGSATLTGNALDWSAGSLMPGQIATITYSVTVNDPITGDQVLKNVVSTPPNHSNCDPPTNDPACTVVNDVPSYTVEKNSAPATTVEGGVVTYTITVRNTGPIAYPATGAGAASFQDELAPGVTDDAAYVNGSATASAGTVGVNGTTVSWTGPLTVDGTATVTYQVKVDTPDAGDHLLKNAVTPTGPGGECAKPGACRTTTPVASYTVSKTSSPDTAKPGDTVTYKVTVRNTGQVDYTEADPASFQDDLTGVLDDASYNGDATDGATFNSPDIIWSGALPIGLSITVQYSVTVDTPDNGNHILTNAVTPTDPTGSCANACTTDTPVASFHVTKVASSTTTKPGQTVTYSITVENTGQVPYTAADPASFTDNLSGVLDDAAYNGDADQGATYTAPVLSWSGALPINGTVVVTYTVTVDDPDHGDNVLRNTVSTPPEANCGPGSTDPACRVDVPVQSYRVVKTTTATAVTPGEQVDYTITVENTGQVPYTLADPATLDDDLTGVLDDATYGNDAVASDGSPVNYTAPHLTWSGALAIAQTITITYSVTVNDPDTGDQHLKNAVTTTGGNCDPGSTDPACHVEVPSKSFRVVKTASESVARPGDTVKYTLVVTNTGQAAYDALSPATYTDDLSGVLDDATFDNDLTGAGASFDANTQSINWSGPLGLDDVVTITYSVTIGDPDPGDKILKNVVTTPPDGNCPPDSTDPDCRTSTPVQTDTVVKTSTPAQTVEGGVVTYTVTIKNTGQAPYTQADPATFSDDLTGVLDDATYNGDATNGATFTAPDISWSGTLDVGQVVVVTYSVTVKEPDAGDHLLKNAVIGGDNCTDPTPPECHTVTPVQSFTVTKVASAATANPGDTITYTTTISNTGQVAYPANAPATMTDTMSAVLDDATYNNDATGGATFSSPTLSWSGALAIGQTITLTYSVTVNDPDTGDHELTNTVVGGTNCPVGSPDPACQTDTIVADYTTVKVASKTTAKPGDVVTYTVTVTNTGQVAYTQGNPATFTDHLAGVLDDATYNGDVTNGATFDGVTSTVDWSGALAVNDHVTVTYSVTVNTPDTGDHVLRNAVTGGSNCQPGSTDPDCHTDIPVAEYTTVKRASTDSAVPGTVVTYTVTITNTGQVAYTAQDPATWDDDLSGVLDDATYNGDATNGATFDQATAKLSWSGPLGIGDIDTITYSVTVNSPDTGDHLLKNAIVGGVNCPPGSPDPDCGTVTAVAGYTTAKVASEATANPGDTVTYTVTVTNVGQVAYTDSNPATWTDDLSGVLDDATYNNDASRGARFDAATSTLSWAGALDIGQVLTITYSVTVGTPDPGDHLLKNAVVGGENCPPAAPAPACHTVTPVAEYTAEKVASATSAKPGDTITYTVTITNTGQVDYTAQDPATWSDDLTGVLDDATYNNDATNGAIFDQAGSTLSWSGALAVSGPAITITYSVTVNDPDAGDHLLKNAIVGGVNCPPNATDPKCHTVTPVEGYTASKVASADQAAPGDTITYTVTITNTGQVSYTDTHPATWSDDLTGVLDDAVYNNDADEGATFDVGTNTIAWSGSLGIGDVVVITYSVTVDNPDTGDHLLENSVVGGDNCPPGSTDPGCSTVTPVADYTIAKTASQAEALPGDTVTYTITIHNTGQVAYTDQAPATMSDDLGQVLDDATYNDDADGGATYAAPVLSWTGALDIGQTVTITYSVTVDNPDTGDHHLRNVAIGGPGCQQSGDAGCDPVDVPVQSYEAVKTVDKEKVKPGERITYTITITNTGQVAYTAQAPAAYTDDLSNVLDDATYDNDATNGATYNAPTLAWSGALDIGQVVVVTYSVTVNTPDTGDKKLKNTVVTTSDGGNCPDASTDPDCTALVPGYELHVAKTSSRANASPGQVVGYAITVTNTGQTDFTSDKPAHYTDDLSGVLDDATYNDDADNGATVHGKTLAWSGPLAVGDSVTIHYSVTVDKPDTGDKLLKNVVQLPPDENSNCSPGSTDPDCRTVTPVKEYEVTKQASSATVAPGDTVTYTVTMRNTGQVAYTDAHPASYRDNLTNVLDDATYNNDATGGATYSAPVLSWRGALDIGGTLTFTYSITVNDPDTGDGKLLNVVTTPTSHGQDAANCSPHSTDPRCSTRTDVSGSSVPPTSFTGNNSELQVIVAACLLAVGGLLTLLGRRRRSAR